ncbi:hypothetical protein L2E82_16803 [Cichorium intybus]|uniref:Uncharacterized protein n=1 Tax=Cichorium intybus TaxID=13427 RepID=A0ACB9F6J3_CICIN|nr:hypothetical protein L2E82_16803 [Cichorium intybus]
MFAAHSIPDSVIPPSNQMEIVQAGISNGVLDNLPPVMTKSLIMLERLGIRPEYLNMEQQGGSHDRGKIGMKNCSSSEHALEMSRHTVFWLLMNVGFDSASVDILAQLVGCHISKLGRILKVLSDSYRKYCSAIGLLKMFLQTIGHGAFSEVVKDGTKNNVQQTQMQVQAMQMQSQTRVGQLHQVSPQNAITERLKSGILNQNASHLFAG